MIRQFLNKLDNAALERILVTAMRPGSYVPLERSGPCLVGVAALVERNDDEFEEWGVPSIHSLVMSLIEPKAPKLMKGLVDCVETRFDALCHREGVEWVTRKVRDRALSILISRGLAVQTIEHAVAGVA